jgi:hypothetical protein
MVGSMVLAVGGIMGSIVGSMVLAVGWIVWSMEVLEGLSLGSAVG